MRAFAREREAAIGGACELHTVVDEALDRRTRLLDHDLHGFAAVLIVPCPKGILEECLVVVIVVLDADAALCKHRIAFLERALREHDNAGGGRKRQGTEESCDAAPRNRHIA